MAASKEAVVIDTSVATRAALAAAVAELTETIASLPVTTIKRRLRDAEISLPFENVCAPILEGLEEK
jgi:hypothetical protein